MVFDKKTQAHRRKIRRKKEEEKPGINGKRKKSKNNLRDNYDSNNRRLTKANFEEKIQD